MQRNEPMIVTLGRAVRAVRASLFAGLVVTPRPEEAFAYVRVIDEEELNDAERRAAIIRERLRREGFLR